MAEVVPTGQSGAEWGGTHTGEGGESVGSALYLGVNTNDDNTLYDAVINNPTRQVFFVPANSVPPGKVWRARIRVRTFGSVLDVGSFTFYLVDTGGQRFGATQSLIGLGGTWTTYTFNIDGTSPADAGHSLNTIECGASGSITGIPLHVLITYVSFEELGFVCATSSDAHSAWSHEGDVEVSSGQDYVETFTPEAGYVIDEILLDDEPIAEAVGLTEYELTIDNVVATHTIVGTAVGIAQELPAAVTVSVSPSGSGKRLGQVMFANPNARTGETTTIRVKPSPGGRIKTVVIDGDDISAANAATWAAAPGGTEFLIEEYEVPAEPVIEATFIEAVDTGGGSYRSGSLTAGAGIENFADRTANVEAALRRDYPVQPF